MKDFITLVIIAIGFSIPGFSQFPPFDTLKYDQVIVYEYIGGEGKEQPLIIDNEKLSSNVTGHLILSDEQTKSIIEILSSNATYGGNKAFCFIPRIGIVFYDNNKPVAHISICMKCNYLISSVHIPATEATRIKISDDYTAPAEGFSESGRQKISYFCEQLKLKNWK